MPSLLIPYKESFCRCLFDSEDEDLISQYNWFMQNGYAACYIKGKSVFMHRLILGLEDPKTLGDHKDGNTLNNCRSNLRAATHSENRRNSRKERNCTSQFKGAYYESDRGRFHSQIGIQGKTYNLGRYADERLAGKAYDRKALELFGEFAHINFQSSKEAQQLKFPWI